MFTPVARKRALITTAFALVCLSAANANADPFDGEWQGKGAPTPACADTAEITFTLHDGRIVRSLITGPRGRGGLAGTVAADGTMNVSSGPLKGQFRFDGDKFEGVMDTFCGKRAVTGSRMH